MFATRPVTPLLFKRLLSIWIALLLWLPASAMALPITKLLNVNVVDVCSSSACASTGPSGDNFYQAETNAIWAQAGIQVNFTNFYYLGGANDSFGGTGVSYGNLFYNVSDSGTNSFANLNSLFGGASSSTVYMFLVHSINAGSGGITFGEGWLGAGGLVVAMDQVLTYNRMDTVAHELGHNLGLVPSPSPNGHDSDPANLMTSGSLRNVPTNISQIGNGYDLIPTNDQYGLNEVAIARSSSLLTDLVPEPSAFALAMAGMAGLIRRSKRATVADRPC